MPRARDPPLTAPNLHAPTPDPGRVHPYGDTLAAIPDGEPDVDAKLWTCTQCGYQWERKREPTQCPNCAALEPFTQQA